MTSAGDSDEGLWGLDLGLKGVFDAFWCWGVQGSEFRVQGGFVLEVLSLQVLSLGFKMSWLAVLGFRGFLAVDVSKVLFYSIILNYTIFHSLMVYMFIDFV